MNKSLPRIFDPNKLLKKSSYFLFGPRGTGKSFLLRKELKKNVFSINLLDSSLYLQLQANPSLLKEIILAKKVKIVVIDEVQRIPELLNIVHLLIEENQIHFILTGSSARKLKTSGTNLLAGRAYIRELFPLTWKEIPKFNLNKYLKYGGLPMSYLNEDPIEYLDAYVNTYLKEEIQAEGLVKKLPAFSQFLQIAATTSGELLNFTSISNETGVSSKTIKDYYSILEDTLTGFMVVPWTNSVKRKPIQTAKFYFFDTGIKNTLSETRELNEKSDLWGRSFENFIAMELRAFLSYCLNKKYALSFWRSTSQFEVDFVIENQAAIEVKATTKLRSENFKGLKALMEENQIKKYYMVSNDKIERIHDGIICLPWNIFLNELWNRKIIV
jgi:predicted AAA+ superfamily ATPase